MKTFNQHINEAEYQGKKVELNNPFRTPDGPKKFSVYVKNDKGNIVKVNFGDPDMEIKRDDPKRRKSFRARHNCDDPGPKWKARYWSCYQWRAGAKVDEEYQRDYKDEYKKFQSSTKMKKYRAELNKYNRQKGTYGNKDKKDASHKDGKIKGFEDESINRGRREKSRLKVNEMKSFQGYLGEAQWQQSTSKMIFDVGTRITDLKFPMSSSMFKRVWPDSFRATVFHVTGPKDFAKVVKLQGKKASISAFFEMAAHYLNTGVQTKGGVVVELDADVLVSGSQDIMSAPDKGGRRWVDLSYLQTINYSKLGTFKKVESDLEELIKDLIKEYIPVKWASKVSLDKLISAWIILGRELYVDKIGMKNLIKDYIDGIETILKTHQKLFKNLFYSYMKKRTTNESWDEQVVNNFKIKKVHLLKDANVWSNPTVDISFYQFSDEIRDKYRLEVKRWKDAQTLEQYIRDVARTGTGSTKEAEQKKATDELEARRKEVLASLGDVSKGGKTPKIVRIK